MPNLSLGIVGLPNVGKSTLFNALSGGSGAEASNYPFCTIDPNVGIVSVPDTRLVKLAELVSAQRIIPAAVEFVDIAGLIKGASQGEGLGNAFLSHIRQTAATILVTRCFHDKNVTHVMGDVNPLRDLETLQTELCLADLETISKAMDRTRKQARANDAESLQRLAQLESLEEFVSSGRPARDFASSDESFTRYMKTELQLITIKPFLVVANVDETEAGYSPSQIIETYSLSSFCDASQIIALSAQVESELSALPDSDRLEFLASYGIQESGLSRLIGSAYALLGLHTFFTAGPKEARAWTIRIGDTAQEAAGVIHTDFSKQFIRAETISYSDYIEFGSEQSAKAAGKMRAEGKEYIVKDGDVMHFRTGA